MVISKMLVLISTYFQPTPLVKLITIPSISNPAAALVSIVPNWTINSIRTILKETTSIISKRIYTMPTIISSIKTISSIPLMLIPSRTNVGVFIKRLLMWIYHLIVSICDIYIILTPGTVESTLILLALTLFIDSFGSGLLKYFFFLSTDVDFYLALFVVADRCKDIHLWSWSNSISISEGVFLSSFTTSTSHVSAFSTLIFCSIYILTLPVFFFYFLLTHLLWTGANPWNLFSVLSVSLVLMANLWRVSCFGFLCFSFFKWNPSGSSEIASHGRSIFLCSTLLFFPYWLFSGYTSYTKLSSPLQSTMLSISFSQ